MFISDEVRFDIRQVDGLKADSKRQQRAVSDRLKFMHLMPAGPKAELDRCIGYWKPYATSHDELDRGEAVQEEVRNAACTLLSAVLAQRDGKPVGPGRCFQSRGRSSAVATQFSSWDILPAQQSAT